jgi:polysaccharide biosynthesis protein PslH
LAQPLPNILFLTHRLPYPPNRGDRIRAFHFLKFLSKHANVYLGALADEPWSEEQEQRLKEVCHEVSLHRLASKHRWIRAATSMIKGGAATTGAFYSHSLAAQIKIWSAERQFDAAIIYCSSMAQYTRDFQTAPRRLLVDLVDVDSQKWLDYVENSCCIATKPKQFTALRDA